jgi:hypothetical protein
MSSPSETIYDYFKGTVYPSKYLDKFTLSKNPVNPLLNVVPLEGGDFFAPKVCNVVCLTGPYVSWDWTSVAAAIARLAVVYDQFAKYESHFIIDADSDDILHASPTDLTEMDNNFIDLMATYSAGSYGIFYWGRLNSTALQEKINEILVNFYQ